MIVLETQRSTPEGILYYLTRKHVKNLNLRVRTDGSIAVSAPPFVPLREIDSFVDCRADWLKQARQRTLTREALHLVPCQVSPQDAFMLFTQISDEIFPLFAATLGEERPLLKIRCMKTRWGVCNPGKRQITLNLRLAEKPREAIEYVILHEYAHFVRADHSAAFWSVVAHWMPDYKARRALLKE